MSDYLNNAKKAKKELEKISNTFCLAKWKQTSLHLTNGMTNSCYHPPLHKIDEKELANNPSALHNTKVKKQARKEMLEGIRPKECGYCWAIEDTGNMSDRHYRSGEDWAYNSFDEVVKNSWDGNINPSYVEVNFSNVCNLACSYCSPQFSSTWGIQMQKYGAYPTTVPHNAPEHFTGSRRVIPNREHNPYVESFWKWWPDLYPQLKHFRMTGGEPLMDKNTYKVFDYVLENPKPDLHLNVTSNFSVENSLFDKYLAKVKDLCQDEKIEHFMQFVSVDTWGKQAEYLRAGLDFNKMQNNVERFLTEIPGRNSVTFIITMNNLSIPNLKKLLEWILVLREKHNDNYQRIWFDLPLLKTPKWQSLQNMPIEYSWYLEQTVAWMKEHEMQEPGLSGFKDYEIDKLQRDVDWMKLSLPEQEIKQNMIDFYKFFVEYDHRNNKSFTETFPEMVEWWGRCKYYAEQN